MSNLLRNAVENRKNELISKLLQNDQYKSDGKQLYELTVTELEYAYFKLYADAHPHGGSDSIVWKNFSNKKR